MGKSAAPQKVDEELVLIQEDEAAPGDPGETLPSSKNAPPGPPNQKVKEVQKNIPDAVPLARSSAEAPAPGAALDTALASAKGPADSSPTDAAPPPPDSKFSQQEVDDEMSAIDNYPIGRDEAINEYVKQMVPWHNRPASPDDKERGPTVPSQQMDLSNNTMATNATMLSMEETLLETDDDLLKLY